MQDQKSRKPVLVIEMSAYISPDKISSIQKAEWLIDLKRDYHVILHLNPNGEFKVELLGSKPLGLFNKLLTKLIKKLYGK